MLRSSLKSESEGLGIHGISQGLNAKDVNFGLKHEGQGLISLLSANFDSKVIILSILVAISLNQQRQNLKSGKILLLLWHAPLGVRRHQT